MAEDMEWISLPGFVDPPNAPDGYETEVKRDAMFGFVTHYRHRRISMTEDQIKHMVSRFLTWRLPENFNPDGGISFKRDFNENTPWPMRHEPTGTNLFDAKQAEAMVRHMLEGMPATSGDAKGWQTVPKTPTVFMIDAAIGCDWRRSDETIKNIWRSMLDASPAPAKRVTP